MKLLLHYLFATAKYLVDIKIKTIIRTFKKYNFQKMYLQIDNALKTVTRLKNLFQMLFLEKLRLIKRS